MTHTILIANRSEIALRIIATAHARGWQTVAVYTEDDSLSPHTYTATYAYQLSGTGSTGYLNQDELLAIAQRAGATAVHPGYGFLAENAEFAQRVIDADLTWIGPKPEHIALMGDKQQARSRMIKAGIPVFPGQLVDASEENSLHLVGEAARRVGYPIILKSTLGGGGKAMRKVSNPDELKKAWGRVVSESINLFGTTNIVCEKFIQNGRHVEVQIAGDGANIVHFFERECSIQRRQQKVIEEAPCSFLPNKLKQQMYQAAVQAGRDLGYCSIGTVEFLVTPDNEFYFLEMNTRLQVEHSVTEMITGVDLVDIQCEIAFENKLELAQESIHARGHAIECRVYAEDCSDNFRPDTGTITVLEFPSNPYSRIDHALYTGIYITPFFDPMIAKISVYGSTRLKAHANMLATLCTTHIQGVANNVTFLQTLLLHEDVRKGTFSTQWLESITPQPCVPEPHTLHLVAAHLAQPSSLEKTKPNKRSSSSPWREQQWN